MSNYQAYFASSGVPATDLTAVTFLGFFNASALTSLTFPTITTAADGWYTFTYTPTETVLGTIDGGSALGDADRYVPVKLTPYDDYIGNVDVAVSTRSDFDETADTVFADVRQWQAETVVTGVVTGIASDVSNIQDYTTALSGTLDVNVSSWDSVSAPSGIVTGNRGSAQ